MKYLSDIISISIQTSPYVGENLIYKVYMRDAFQGGGRTLIYTGSLYCLGVAQTIYLNDIVASHTYDNGYAKRKGDRPNPSGVLFDIIVEFLRNGSVIETKTVSSDPYIMNCYMDKGTPRKEVLNDDGLFEDGEGIYDALSFRTDIFPRVPRLASIPQNFTFNALLFLDNAAYEDDGINISGFDNDNYKAHVRVDDVLCVTPITLLGSDYNKITKTSNAIYACTPDGSYSPTTKTKIANIDTCPSRYYLTWIDRTGGWMCWPFNGRCTPSENITTSYKTDLLNNQSPYKQEVTTKWTLNTKSLSFDERKAMESILVSPYCALYDTTLDEMTEVVVNTKTYEVKDKDNTKGLFNLTLEVQTSSIQNITY